MRRKGCNESGKIAEAVWVTSQFPTEIEADLHRYYNLDFVDLYRPGSSLTWRKLLVLLKNLPPESAVNTAMRNTMTERELSRTESNPGEGRWSNVETLLATAIDEIRNLTWAYVSAHSNKNVPRPPLVRRPGVSAGKPPRVESKMSLEDLQRMDPRLAGLSAEEAQKRLDELTGGGSRGRRNLS